MLIFAVFDSKAEKYLQPFYSPTAAAAVRAVTAAVADPTHEFHRFAEDYTLFEVGHWNEDEGLLSGQAPRSVVGCWTLKASLKAQEPHNGRS